MASDAVNRTRATKSRMKIIFRIACPPFPFAPGERGAVQILYTSITETLAIEFFPVFKRFFSILSWKWRYLSGINDFSLFLKDLPLNI